MYIDSVGILDGFRTIVLDFADRFANAKSKNEVSSKEAENSTMYAINKIEESKQKTISEINSQIQDNEIMLFSIDGNLVREIEQEKLNCNSLINEKYDEAKKILVPQVQRMNSMLAVKAVLCSFFACECGVYKVSKHHEDVLLPEVLIPYYPYTYSKDLSSFYWYDDYKYTFGEDEAPIFVQDARNRLGLINEENSNEDKLIRMICDEVCTANSLEKKIGKGKERQKHKENAIYLYIQFCCYVNKTEKTFADNKTALLNDTEQQVKTIKQSSSETIARLKSNAIDRSEKLKAELFALRKKLKKQTGYYEEKINIQYQSLKDTISSLNDELKNSRTELCEEIKEKLRDYFDRCLQGVTVGLNPSVISMKELVKKSSAFEVCLQQDKVNYVPPSEYKTYICIGSISFDYEKLAAMRSCIPLLKTIKSYLGEYFNGDDKVTQNGFTIPYIIDFTYFEGLCFEYPEEYYSDAQMACRSVMFHMLTDTKPLSVNYTMIDSKIPSGFFSTFTSFTGPEPGIMSVMNKCRIFNTENDISESLSALNNGISELSKKFNFSSVIEFNRTTLARKKEINAVFVSDIDNEDLLGSSCEQLNTIIQAYGTGYSCVFMRALKTYHNKQFSSQLKYSGAVFEYISKDDIYKYCVKGTDYIVRVYPMPSDEMITTVGRNVKSCINEATPDKIRFDIKTATSKVNDSVDGLFVDNCFYDENNSPLKFVLNDIYLNCMIMGSPGYGKTRLIHTIIDSLIGKYSPDAIKIHFLDFKAAAMGPNNYCNKKIPHFGVVSNITSRVFGKNFLDHIVCEMAQTGKIIQSADSSIDNLSDYLRYRQRHWEMKFVLIPRQIIIIDEIQELLTPADELSKACIESIGKIIRYGRAYGVHLILSTQWVENLEQSLNPEFIKVGFQSKVLFHSMTGYGKLDVDKSKLDSVSYKGQAYYIVDQNGSTVDIALIDGNEETEYLKTIEFRYTNDSCNTMIIRNKISDGRQSDFVRFYNGAENVDLGNMPIILGETIEFDRRLLLQNSDEELISLLTITSDNQIVQSVSTTAIICLLSRIYYRQVQNKTTIIFADYTNCSEFINDTFCPAPGLEKKGAPEVVRYCDNKKSSDTISYAIKQLEGGKLDDVFLFVNGLSSAIKNSSFIESMSILAVNRLRVHLFLFGSSSECFKALENSTSMKLSDFTCAIYDGSDMDYDYTVGSVENYLRSNALICRRDGRNYQIAPFDYSEVDAWIEEYLKKLKAIS